MASCHPFWWLKIPNKWSRGLLANAAIASHSLASPLFVLLGKCRRVLPKFIQGTPQSLELPISRGVGKEEKGKKRQTFTRLSGVIFMKYQ